MRIAVLGGGPGGLYFAYLWKKRHPDATIDLFEQNPAGATWGFCVVFSEQALEFLRADDPETVDAIAPRMESWKNITLHLREDTPLDPAKITALIKKTHGAWKLTPDMRLSRRFADGDGLSNAEATLAELAPCMKD